MMYDASMGSGWIRGEAVMLRGTEQDGWRARPFRAESRQSYKKAERAKETEEISWDNTWWQKTQLEVTMMLDSAAAPWIPRSSSGGWRRRSKGPDAEERSG
jgi:hypothetical protein